MVDAVVPRLDLQADDRAAVLELDALDLADLDARDVDRLPLARRDGLGGRDLGLDLVEVLADHRHPARQRQPLVGRGSPTRRGSAISDQADDRHEVLDVLADRDHRVELAASVGAVLAAAGPLRFGSLLVWQGDVGPVGRALAGIERPVAERDGDVVAEQPRRSRRPRCPSRWSARRRRSGSARTCRCRRSSGPRPRGRRGRRRTPCSSPRRWSNSSSITTSPVGSSTWRAQREVSVGLRQQIDRRRRSAARGRAWPGESSLTSPPSSCWETSLRVWRDPRERRRRSSPASRGRRAGSRARTRAWAGTPR